MALGDAPDCIQPASDCCVHFLTDSLQGVCNLLCDLLLQRHQVCCGGHTCLLPDYATAAACGGAYQRSATMTNASLFCGNLEPKRECIGRMVKWAQQLCDKGNKVCRSVTVSSLCAFQHKQGERDTETER